MLPNALKVAQQADTCTDRVVAYSSGEFSKVIDLNVQGKCSPGPCKRGRWLLLVGSRSISVNKLVCKL